MSQRRGGNSRRAAGALSVIWGVTLSAQGSVLFTRLQGRSPDDNERRAVHLLGIRHLLQGSLQLAAPDRFANLHTTIDAIHAATMIIDAITHPRRRRVAALSATTALVSAWNLRRSLRR
jgi:hypothetical protein